MLDAEREASLDKLKAANGAESIRRKWRPSSTATRSC